MGFRRGDTSSHPQAAGSSSSSVDISSISIPSISALYALSWIFNTRAEPGTNPWGWEWGSPESFADLRSRPMDRPMTVPLPPGHRFMRPAVTAHDDNSTGWARRPVYGPPQVGRSNSCHNDEDYVHTRRRPAPAIAWWWDDMDFAFRTGAKHPNARIQHGRAGTDMLMRYYRKHGAYKGAEVYIKPNVCHDPAAATHDDYYKVDLRSGNFHLGGPIPASTT